MLFSYHNWTPKPLPANSKPTYSQKQHLKYDDHMIELVNAAIRQQEDVTVNLKRNVKFNFRKKMLNSTLQGNVEFNFNMWCPSQL